MAANSQPNDWSKLLVILLLLWPLVLFFFIPQTNGVAPMLLWIIAIGVSVLGWVLLGRTVSQRAQAQLPAASPVETPAVVADAMDVDEALELAGGARLYEGRLRAPADVVFEQVSERLGRGFVPLLQNAGDRTALLILPKPVEEAALQRKSRPIVNWILLLLTLLTTTFAGAAHQGVNLLREPERFTTGLPYSLALMAILGCHELGHYFTARHHGMNVTPPYFIPVPFALGTFGAFIQMKTPPRNRRALFDVAVAGPLAGLVIAIPALYFGLQASEVVPGASAREQGFGALPGASVMLTVVAHWALDLPASGDVALHLSPMAFAGWLGLMVTALNLLPIGQLDGGHIARSMFGTRVGAAISGLSMLALFLLAIFVWPGLLMWAIIVFFLTGRPTPPLNDVSRITPVRFLLGVAAFILLALIVMPAELLAGTMQCPYL